MYQQKCPIYRNSKAVRDMVLFLMISLDGGKVHTRVTNKVPSLGAAISPDGPKVHTQVANEVPSLGATISPNGPRVHTRVANDVPSLGATTDEQKAHTRVAIDIPNFGATISLCLGGECPARHPLSSTIKAECILSRIHDSKTKMESSPNNLLLGR